MTYIVKWTSKATKVLKKLQPNVALRIWEKIEGIKENPFRYLEHYEDDSFYKLRIGNYRALIDVDSKNKILKVRVLDKRSRVYKRQ